MKTRIIKGPFVFRLFSAAVSLLLVSCLMTGCGAKAEIPVAYDYDDLSEYIKLGNYKGVEYEKEDTQVSDSEIQEYVENAVSETGTSVENTSGKVKKDSVINFDYTGSIDGVEFDGGSATDVELDIADNNYIPGFADQIIGHKAGENFDITVTFPENYGSEDLAGKEAVFNITVNSIIEEVVPEYNDEWVAANTEYSTTAEYEKSVKEQLAANKESTAETSARVDVFSTIVDDSEVISYPEKELNERIETLTNSYKGYAEANDMEFSEYLEDQMGIDEEAFNELAKSAAEDAVKQELVLYSIARLENIAPTADEYNDYLLGILEDAGYTEASYEEEKGCTIQEYAAENNLFTTFMYQKVMDKVMEYSVEK